MCHRHICIGLCQGQQRSEGRDASISLYRGLYRGLSRDGAPSLSPDLPHTRHHAYHTTASTSILFVHNLYHHHMSLQLNLRSAFLGKASVRAASPMASKPAGSSNATRSVTAMAKKKGIRVIVTLECTEARSEGGTPSRVREMRWSFGPREISRRPAVVLDERRAHSVSYNMIWTMCSSAGSTRGPRVRCFRCWVPCWVHARPKSRCPRARPSHHANSPTRHLVITPTRQLTRFAPVVAPQYTTQKSKKNTPERIEMKKYNKYLRRHTLHREIK